MTNRVSYSPQDFEKKCKQAERDHEERKLAVLLEKVKRQIADRDGPEGPEGSQKRPLMAVNGGMAGLRRGVVFER